MRHRLATKKFGRDTLHRKALLKNLVRSLVLDGEITTSTAKAKEARRISDKLISKAQKNDISSRRVLHRFFGRRDVVNSLVDRIAPAFKKRTSGFTSLVKIGKRRGDNTELSKLSLVVKPEILKTLKSGKTYSAKVKAKSVAKAKPAAKKAKEVTKKVTKKAVVKPKAKSATKTAKK